MNDIDKSNTNQLLSLNDDMFFVNVPDECESENLFLSLNPETITQLDSLKLGSTGILKTPPNPEAAIAFLSIWGSNCYATNPSKHKCCEGTPDPVPDKMTKEYSCCDVAPPKCASKNNFN